MESVYTPQQVADSLGLSTSMVRKYSQAFEKVKGKLPRDNRNGRLYTKEHLAFFREVNERIKDGQTLEEAMMTLAAPFEDDLSIDLASNMGASEALELLRRLVAKVETLEAEVKALRALPAVGDQTERLLTLEKRNHYLFQELKRRDELAHKPQPTWWQFWRR